MSEEAPEIAHYKGFHVEVKAGERYLWCSCGRSAKQPFCDFSHKGTDFRPVVFVAERDDDVLFCGCKHTGTAPFCDGSHNNLPGGYREDDPESDQNGRIREVAPTASPKVPLDGACYVFSPARAPLSEKGTIRYCPVINPAEGARYQSQFYVEAGPGISPVISADGRDTVLFITAGSGEVEICGRRFPAEARSGLYIRPDESYRIHNSHATPVTLFVSNGPGSADLAWRDSMEGEFAPEQPDRVAEIDPSQRQAMAARYFQMLICRDHGSTRVTQFCGNIPLSKGEPHRHLYEEALIILTGEGVVWTEETKTPIGAGDVLFLPRKQIHSVQCTVPQGMEVVGVIYPGDNPSINY